ncbi:DUF982 domain-containing protein [Sinorhizobium numidicum]|uniref:DUF982 domain-containing protein n=1 Tax=Sinorhizobium numidicum TaxID=680248 RepID=A0ABY8CR34_9HYPH|nr:DUF982 domain-containing protein [Sinorhizobium numidicum]WEX75111.1 DUF982 domain-containing protein [Sinorhizobium numidicum]WEX81105.1 DUF982 domain-containing protein [Sinorhizobium numidicum]
MHEIPWSTPVRLRFEDGTRMSIDGPRDGLNCLLQMWPTDHGEFYEKAKRQCYAALEHVKTPDEARETFIAASKEASLIVQ